MKTKTKSRKYLKRKADRLWSEIIKSKGRCEMCGKPANNPHHIVGRRNHALRWDIRNGCLLCANCHTFSKFSAHQDPIGFLEWFKIVRNDDYEYLLSKRNEVWDKDYDKVIKDLEEVKNEIIST
ncbi:MAG: HNH endonuclease [Candidatus Pacearchaeota archaeon]|jgi:hypothetical protein